MSYLRANFRVYSGTPVLIAPAGTHTATSSWISDYGTHLALPSGMLLVSSDYSTIFLYTGTKFYWTTKTGTS